MTPNLTNIDKLITWLREYGAKQFAMDHIIRDKDGSPAADITDCGTVVCLQGACHYLRTEEEVFSSNSTHVLVTANWLGLSFQDADHLFTPNGFFSLGMSLPHNVQTDAAIAVLEGAKRGEEIPNNWLTNAARRFANAN